MGIVKTDITVSADGYLAGPNQSLEGPFGEGGLKEPPYHAPVYVLTHHPRNPVPAKGGTTFHFVTDGIESALRQAREAAGDQDVQIVGGANTVQQYLAADLLDELVLHVVPLTLGAGERLLDGVGGLAFEQVEASPAPAVTHVRYRVAR